uniref:Uncharacterized protein n=1 Tax=Cacopsylla melanoneura TaxID=428564 RepID=A0A8D9A6D6_9HEMI
MDLHKITESSIKYYTLCSDEKMNIFSLKTENEYFLTSFSERKRKKLKLKNRWVYKSNIKPNHFTKLKQTEKKLVPIRDRVPQSIKGVWHSVALTWVYIRQALAF